MMATKLKSIESLLAPIGADTSNSPVVVVSKQEKRPVTVKDNPFIEAHYEVIKEVSCAEPRFLVQAEVIESGRLYMTSNESLIFEVESREDFELLREEYRSRTGDDLLFESAWDSIEKREFSREQDFWCHSDKVGVVTTNKEYCQCDWCKGKYKYCLNGYVTWYLVAPLWVHHNPEHAAGLLRSSTYVHKDLTVRILEKAGFDIGILE